MEFSGRFLSEEDKQKIKSAVQLHSPIEITTYTLPREMEMYIQEVLTVFLIECHQEHMTDNLIFCLGELLTNSKKANTKRIYFKEHNLDINDEMDYHSGMVSFKEDMLNDLRHYLEAQKAAGLYIKLVLKLNEDGIKIEIRNNSVLTTFERKRINEKLRAAQKYTDPQQVIAKVIDQTEGAGLGIIIIVLMLQKIGLSKDNYKVFATETETITQMILPLNEEISKSMNAVYDVFVKNTNAIPVLDTNFDQFTKLINDENSTDEDIVNFIMNDVTITALLLKKAYEIDSSCDKLSKAYEILGKEKIKEIISTDNKELVLIPSEKDTREFWKHEKDVAFYSYNIAQNLCKDEFDLEKVYLCGLFHDISCLMLEVADDEQKAAAKSIADTFDDGEKIYSLFLQNFCHGKGCYEFTKKWNISDDISQVVGYHNNPDAAPEHISKIVYIIYLADMLQYYKSGEVEFYQLNEKVLKYFDIDSKKKLDFIIEKLNV